MADFFGTAEVRNDTCDRVVVFEFQKWGEFILIQLADADLHVFGEDEIDERLLLGREVCADGMAPARTGKVIRAPSAEARPPIRLRTLASRTLTPLTVELIPSHRECQHYIARHSSKLVVARGHEYEAACHGCTGRIDGSAARRFAVDGRELAGRIKVPDHPAVGRGIGAHVAVESA